MALIIVDSSDTIADVVGKINEISARIGDLLTLTDVETDMVTAVNNYREQITKLDDSAEQVALARRTFNILVNPGNGNLQYNEATGVITFTGQSAGEVTNKFNATNGLTYSNGNIYIANGGLSVTYFDGGSISSNVYANPITTNVINSAGTTIRTLRTPRD